MRASEPARRRRLVGWGIAAVVVLAVVLSIVASQRPSDAVPASDATTEDTAGSFAPLHLTSLDGKQIALPAGRPGMVMFVGVLAERSNDDEHHEPAAVVQDQAEGTHNEAPEAREAGDAEANEAAEGREGEQREPSDEAEAAPRETGEHDAEARLLGIDPESTPLLVIAVAAGLALTALAASRMGTSRAFLVVVAMAALVWAALDIREIAHQIDESRSGIAAISAVVAALHLAAAAVASFLARSPEVRGRGAS
jgi:hypothetical protein